MSVKEKGEGLILTPSHDRPVRRERICIQRLPLRKTISPPSLSSPLIAYFGSFLNVAPPSFSVFLCLNPSGTPFRANHSMFFILNAQAICCLLINGRLLQCFFHFILNPNLFISNIILTVFFTVLQLLSVFRAHYLPYRLMLV